MFPFSFASGLALGLAMGNSDSPYLFGPAIAAQAIRFRQALLLSALFIVVGALVGGEASVKTLSDLGRHTLNAAVLASLAAALCVFAASLLGFSPSVSQCIVGAIIGLSLIKGETNLPGLSKILLSWLTTPLAGALAALLLQPLLHWFFNRLKVNIFTLDKLLRTSLILGSCYAAFALGANNSANALAIFVASGTLSPATATLGGSLSMAAGVFITSRELLYRKVGKLIPLDSFTALVSILAEGLAVHFFSIIGVPVSSGQALSGALLGLGLYYGMQTISYKSLIKILLTWLLLPLSSGLLAALLALLVNLSNMAS